MLALNPALNAFSPELVTRLLTDALTALGDIARSSANPIERRRAATTLLRFMTARPPRPARDTKAPTPRATPDSPTSPTAPHTAHTPTAIPPVPIALSAPPTQAQPRPLHPVRGLRAAHTLLARAGAPPH
ncbi:MAG TPA: hypothetical protein VHN77_02770 [Phycisphaerales bacterium]|nr:hypothetical protein [Phycisphaerales bacterium]